MSLKNVNHQKRSFTWSMEKPSAKDYFLTVFIFAVCTLIGLLFQKLNFTDTNIVTIYILGVLLTSIVTDGYLCSVAGSFLSVFLFWHLLPAFIFLRRPNPIRSPKGTVPLPVQSDRFSAVLSHPASLSPFPEDTFPVRLRSGFRQ